VTCDLTDKLAISGSIKSAKKGCAVAKNTDTLLSSGLEDCEPKKSTSRSKPPPKFPKSSLKDVAPQTDSSEADESSSNSSSGGHSIPNESFINHSKFLIHCSNIRHTYYLTNNNYCTC